MMKLEVGAKGCLAESATEPHESSKTSGLLPIDTTRRNIFESFFRIISEEKYRGADPNSRGFGFDIDLPYRWRQRVLKNQRTWTTLALKD